MTLTIEHIHSCSIAYIRCVGPYGAGNVRAMEELKSWAAACGLLNDASVILGIAQDDPETTRPEDCRYDACLVIAGGGSPNAGAVSFGRVAGGKYAVITIAHTAQTVEQAWVDIFPELAKHGCRIDAARPVMERYKTKMVREHKCEICVPII